MLQLSLIEDQFDTKQYNFRKKGFLKENFYYNIYPEYLKQVSIKHKLRSRLTRVKIYIYVFFDRKYKIRENSDSPDK